MRRRHSTAAAVVALLVGAGCRPAEPDARGEYVDLFVDDGIEVCGGQLARDDAFIEHIFEVWTGAPPAAFRIDVHATRDLGDTPCASNAAGCFVGSEMWFDHQLVQDNVTVHAMIRATDGRSAPFFEIGVPIAFAPVNPFYYPTSQLAEFEQTLLSEPVPDAYEEGKLGLIARYLIDRHGSAAFRDYFHALASADGRTPEEFQSGFADAFGETLDVAWADLKTAPRCAFDFRFCDEGESIELPFELDGVDCADAGTIGYSAPDLEQPTNHPFHPERILLLENPEARRVSFDLAAGTLMVVACGACPAELWDSFEPQTFELDLSAGNYALVAGAFDGAAQLSVTATP